MRILLTSTTAIAPDGEPNQAVVDVLIEARKSNLVGIVSGHSKPAWFDSAFGISKVQFLQVIGRQSGNVITKNLAIQKIDPHDVIVLAACQADIAMGKNGGAIIVAAGWSADAAVQDLGVRVCDPDELLTVIGLTHQWNGGWWFKAEGEQYGVRALTDLSSVYVDDDQAEFGRRLTRTVKAGGAKLTALLTVAARSLLQEGTATKKHLFWGVYPSSSSANDDTEVLSEFTHRLRTLSSRVRMAERGQPLFIRHQAAPKRSIVGGDRNDPTKQVESLHLNPHYERSLHGRHVIVIDDCLTYGLSFGVAAAFLKRAGVASVLGVALGKFGNRANEHSIEITGNPFAPISIGQFVVNSPIPFDGEWSQDAQTSLKELIG
jgi:hypothetical protein